MRRVVLTMLLASALAFAVAGPAFAGTGESGTGATRTIHFTGEKVKAPASWPVFRLDENPRMCVRMDRRAVYLGTPGAQQRCPASAMGKRRAILVDPAAPAGASATPSRTLQMAGGTNSFVGLGFDACAAPSSRTMRAWDSSPYRSVGVYIGGVNRACSQPNLTASWVAEQVAAGWYLIPTYVGLQATTSTCTSCATLNPATAAAQGAAAATDAVAAARAIGMGPGSPIYNDMEAYRRTPSATSSTLAFLGAWTDQLHALGYQSGVYSSSASGIADLVSRIGFPYSQPDNIWTANWNGKADAADPYVPSYAWSQRQRIHQYRGSHNETWGGVTINIDNNYVEGATVGSATGTPDDPVGSLDAVESPAPGQLRVVGWAIDPNAPRKATSIRVYLGGKAGAAAKRYDLGPIAALDRSELPATYPTAGSAHGFDASFPVVGSGRQRVCVYAVNIGRGSDTLLGCRGVGVPVPVAFSVVAAKHNSVRVRVHCLWPAGTQCPGQIMLRANVRKRVAVQSGGRRLMRVKVTRRGIAKRTFRLVGGRSHAFHVPLSSGGRSLVRGKVPLKAQLVVAIPGGRAAKGVQMR